MAIIDLVSWAPDRGKTVFAHKFVPANHLPSEATNLSTYTQLIVQESQEAVLFTKGQIAGKFGPGKHTLNTENLPILRSLYGIPFGGKNPFTAEVWFVNKLQPYNIEWKINRMDIHDPDYNTGIPLIASGLYGLKIKDAERFLLKIVGTKTEFDEEDLTKQFEGEFTTKTKSVLMQFMMSNRIGLKQISAYLDSTSEHLRSVMLPFWENLGFELVKFYVTTIEVDNTNPVGERILDAMSRQSAQAIGGYTWQQSQAFEITKGAVDNISGGGGAGLLGAVVATNLMGGLGGGGGVMQPQYNQPTFSPGTAGPQGGPGAQGPQGGPTAQIPQMKEVFCSNCAKKYPNTHQFCPYCGDAYNPCPKCGTDNDSNAKRCVSCGTQLRSDQGLCPSCNSAVPASSAFCPNCGKAMAEDKCSRCGTQLPPSIKFCPRCGQKR